MPVNSYKSSIRYLESLIPDPSQKRQGNMRLERIRHLLCLIGNPQNSFKSIHIGGTSGKGSTAYMTAAILKEAGYRVGLHVSPHLEKINERMQYNGEPILDAEFAKLVTWIKPYVSQVEREGVFGKPSYFEVLVALSFEYFKRKKVDIAVVEVGLGGTLDATNVISPEVAVITNVDLDHTEILGNTVEKIASDKAGIIKESLSANRRGIRVITAARQKSVLEIIKKRCKEKHANLTIIGKNPKVPPLGPLGDHQKINAACAIAAVRKIQDARYKMQTPRIQRVLKNIVIPGRLEIISRNSKFVLRDSRVILDGAHNPAKTKSLVTALKKLYPKKKFVFVFAAKKGKDAEVMLRLLAPIAEKFYFTCFQATTDFGKNRSMSPEELSEILRGINQKISAEIFQTSKEAVQKAMSRKLKTKNLVCVTGSLYLVGEVRKSVKR